MCRRHFSCCSSKSPCSPHRAMISCRNCRTAPGPSSAATFSMWSNTTGPASGFRSLTSLSNSAPTTTAVAGSMSAVSIDSATGAEFGAAEHYRRLGQAGRLPAKVPAVVGDPRRGRRVLRVGDHPADFRIRHHRGQLPDDQPGQFGQLADQLAELAGRALEHHGVQITQHVGAAGNDLPPIRQRSAAIHERRRYPRGTTTPPIRTELSTQLTASVFDLMFPRFGLHSHGWRVVMFVPGVSPTTAPLGHPPTTETHPPPARHECHRPPPTPVGPERPASPSPTSPGPARSTTTSPARMSPASTDATATRCHRPEPRRHGITIGLARPTPTMDRSVPLRSAP